MMKKFLTAALVTALSLNLLACGGSSADAPAADAPAADAPAADAAQTADAPAADAAGGEKHYKFGYTCMDGTNPFFVTIQDEMKSIIEARGDELVITDPGNDVTKQISQVEDMLSQDLDGLFMNPADAEGILPALDAAKAEGVPMVGFDTEVADLSYLVSYTGSDNYNAGKVCGEDLVKKCPNGGDILVLDSPTMQSVTDRTNGFLDAIEGHGFNVVGQQDAKGNLEVAMGIAEDLLQAHPDVVAIFGGNDPTALGCLAAANAAGIKDCKIYGVDGSPDIKAELASGDSLIEGTGAQSPKSIADKAVEIMYDYMEGKPVEDRYPVETFLITSENVNDYGTDGWQ
ncbi:MAG: sugar ABC transporter substrate-binding protein [Lachnospiraceae bacterium]|nr:sugar ABC transporter substrate-binding protein [Lachnospiraceae bacterium]